MRTGLLVASIGLILAVAPPPLHAEKDKLPTVRVFVTIREIDGFQSATQASNESVADLVAELKRLKFQVVSTAEAANLVVVLTARNGTSELAGTNAAAIPIGNAILMPVRPNYAYTFTMHATVELGSVRRELTGVSNRNYRDCARRVVLDLNAWVVANMTLIVGASAQAPTPSIAPPVAPVASDSTQRVATPIASEPAGAEIFVDGTFVGSTPSQLMIAVGEHSILILRPGFKEWERRVTIEAGSAKTFNAILVRHDP